jgi:hypothetical protein
VPGGFTRDAFTVDLQANTVTCPAGHTVAINAEPPSGVRLALWPLPAPQALHHRQGRQNPQHAFPGSRTGGGPPPRHRPDLPGQLPSLAADGGTLDRMELVANGHRRVRYRGRARNQLGLSVRVAAINLRRLIAMGLDHTDAGWVLA